MTIVKETGADKLTMPKLAIELDVSPVAVYKHFKNKDELLRSVLNEFIAQADVLPSDELDWAGWLSSVAHKMYRALKTNSNWLPLMGSFEMGEYALVITIKVIEKLKSAGFDDQQALHGFFAMIHIVLGSVSIQTAVEKWFL